MGDLKTVHFVQRMLSWPTVQCTFLIVSFPFAVFNNKLILQCMYIVQYNINFPYRIFLRDEQQGGGGGADGPLLGSCNKWWHFLYTYY